MSINDIPGDRAALAATRTALADLIAGFTPVGDADVEWDPRGVIVGHVDGEAVRYDVPSGTVITHLGNYTSDGQSANIVRRRLISTADGRTLGSEKLWRERQTNPAVPSAAELAAADIATAAAYGHAEMPRPVRKPLGQK